MAIFQKLPTVILGTEVSVFLVQKINILIHVSFSVYIPPFLKPELYYLLKKIPLLFPIMNQILRLNFPIIYLATVHFKFIHL